MEWGDGATNYKGRVMENAPWYEILEPAEAVQYLAHLRLDESIRKEVMEILAAVKTGKWVRVRPRSKAEEKTLKTAFRKLWQEQGNDVFGVAFDKAEGGFIVRQMTMEEVTAMEEKAQARLARRKDRKQKN